MANEKIIKEPIITKTPAAAEGNVPGVVGASVPPPNKEKSSKKAGQGSGGSELSDIEGGTDECNQSGCGEAA